MPRIAANRRFHWFPKLLATLLTLSALALSGAYAMAQPDDFDAALWPRLTPPLPPDPALETFVTELMGRMTLEEKVGQVIQADAGSIRPEDLLTYPLGSILASGDFVPGGDKHASTQVWLALADAYFDATQQRQGARVPLLLGVDAVHGHNRVLGATIFPHNIGLGAARDPDLLRRIGEATALEVLATGLDWTFAPTLAVARDSRWGRTYESYSENPELVALYAAAMVEGLQGKVGTPGFLGAGHVLATAKHFLGDGGTDGGRDQGDNLSSALALRGIHTAGYPPALNAGVQTVMASFSSWHGAKLHGDHELLTGILKDRMGFDGFVVGDWNGHAQLPGCSAASCPAALLAGIDLFMAPDAWRALFDNTLAQVRSGEIPLARLDDAVRRILRVKARAGLFDRVRPSERPYAGQPLGTPEHRALARQAVRESLVLLKNDGGLLPLRRDLTVLVAGDGADNIGKQCGGWTLGWQGQGNGNADFPNGQSIYGGIAETATGRVLLSPGGSFDRRPEAPLPDVAIVVFGEEPYAEMLGDRTTTSYSATRPEDVALLRRLRAAGIPVVAVFLSGRPLWVNPELNAADAFVAAWLPGSEGGGIADLLFRAADGGIAQDFSGKLSFAWPRSPVPGTSRKDPLFPYGFGLTYGDAGSLGPLPED